jgi:hypothetical protein
MTEIATPARIITGKHDCCAPVTPRSAPRRILDLVANTILFGSEGDVASRYQGTSWCDSIEYDLHHDIMIGRRTRR